MDIDALLFATDNGEVTVSPVPNFASTSDFVYPVAVVEALFPFMVIISL